MNAKLLVIMSMLIILAVSVSATCDTWEVVERVQSDGISCSNDGAHYIISSFGYTFTSNDFGVSSAVNTMEASLGDKSSVVSGDGTKFWYIGSGSGVPYYSSDGGANFNGMTFPSIPTYSLASNYNGSYLYASSGGAVNSPMKVSNDFGATWGSISSGAPRHAYVTTNYDGNAILVSSQDSFGATHGDLYYSNDYGATWTFIDMPNDDGRFKGIDMSNDGTILIASIMNGGYVYISNDSGSTWIPQVSLGNRSWSGATVNGDGTKFAVGDSSGELFVSNDSGSTWFDAGLGSSVTSVDFAKGVDILYSTFSGANTYRFTYCVPLCSENWTSSFTSCVNSYKTKIYTDANTCGTFIDLPVDNGTVSACSSGGGGGGGVRYVAPQQVITGEVTASNDENTTSALSSIMNKIFTWFRNIFN